MYPKLKPEPVSLQINGKVYKIPRNCIVAAYAGALAAKEEKLWGSNPLTANHLTFKVIYQASIPECIQAANMLGLSAVPETLDYWNPCKSADVLLREQQEHSDNPFYPFFEKD